MKEECRAEDNNNFQAREKINAGIIILLAVWMMVGVFLLAVLPVYAVSRGQQEPSSQIQVPVIPDEIILSRSFRFPDPGLPAAVPRLELPAAADPAPALPAAAEDPAPPPGEPRPIKYRFAIPGAVRPASELAFLGGNNSRSMRNALLSEPLSLIRPENRVAHARAYGLDGSDDNELAEAVMTEVAVKWFSNQFHRPSREIRAAFGEITRQVFGRQLTGGEAYLELRKLEQRKQARLEQQRAEQEKAKQTEYRLVFIVSLWVVVAVVCLLVLLFSNIHKIATLAGRIRAAFGAFSELQKILLGLTVMSMVLLAMALSGKWSTGFYVFLRITTCAALAGPVGWRIPAGLKLPLILLAILYNPVFPIHLGAREIWAVFNLITIPLLAAPWVVLLHRSGRPSSGPSAGE